MVDEKLEKFSQEIGIESDIFVASCAAASQKMH